MLSWGATSVVARMSRISFLPMLNWGAPRDLLQVNIHVQPEKSQNPHNQSVIETIKVVMNLLPGMPRLSRMASNHCGT